MVPVVNADAQHVAFDRTRRQAGNTAERLTGLFDDDSVRLGGGWSVRAYHDAGPPAAQHGSQVVVIHRYRILVRDARAASRHDGQQR